MKLLVLTRYGDIGASSRLRFYQYFPFLNQKGFEIKVSPLFNNKALSNFYNFGKYSFFDLIFAYLKRIKELIFISNYDIIWIEKEALPWIPAFIELFLLKRKKYILDYDDAIFHNYDLTKNRIIKYFFAQRIDLLMKYSSSVMVGNTYLADRAKVSGANNIQIIHTVVDLLKYKVQNKKKNIENSPTIVWIGTKSTVKYLVKIKEVFIELSKKYDFVLKVIGADISIPGVKIKLVKWLEKTEVDEIANCDIGIMPLIDTPWERGKCGYKLIQYMACGLPVVASPVGINSYIVDVNNGFLATDNKIWHDVLEILLQNQEMRLSMGIKGRFKVESEFNINSTLPKIISTFES